MTGLALLVAANILVTLGGGLTVAGLVLRMRQSRRASSHEDLRRLGELVESLESRMSRLEERHDFTDALLDRENLPSPASLLASAAGEPRASEGKAG